MRRDFSQLKPGSNDTRAKTAGLAESEKTWQLGHWPGLSVRLRYWQVGYGNRLAHAGLV